MIKVEFKLKSKDPKVTFAKLNKVFRSFEPELKLMGRDLMKYFRDDVFETEGAIFGEGWKELTPEYQKRKVEKYPGRGILERTGEMRKGYRLFTSTQMAIIRNIKDYAKIHQDGKGNMPKRTLVKVDRMKKDQIGEMFKKHIQERVAQALS